MSSRRDFLKKATIATAGITFSVGSPKVFAQKKSEKKLTILHTNDTHCQINPFEGGELNGKGGFARLSAIINKIRSQEKNVLLFDSGDMFQGTPFFNKFNGELVLKVMSKIAYDAATIGNHEFDNGLDSFVESIKHAKFPFINSNYDFSQTKYHKNFLSYNIFVKQGIKIGVYGLGIELNGLVDTNNTKGIKYIDPIKVAQETEQILKLKYKCNLIICLSHIGLEYKQPGLENKISDKNLVPHTKYTDIILGGHTHTFMDQPYYGKNLEGKSVLVNQAGAKTLRIGRIDIIFNKNNNKLAYIKTYDYKNNA